MLRHHEPAVSARSLGLFGVAGVVSITAFLAGLPLTSMGLIAGATVLFVLGTLRPWSPPAAIRDELPPEEVVSFETREALRGILSAQRQLERVVDESTNLAPSIRSVLDRVVEVVTLSQRMARLSNPLQRYLDDHDPTVVRAELDRLRGRAEATGEAHAAAAFGHAAAARARQLATIDEIVALRDRIDARLELVRAALEAFTATIVRLRGDSEDHQATAGETVTEQLDHAANELAIVETTLDELAA
jgi:hypothetical protein